MGLRFEHARLPGDRELVDRVSSAAASLHAKLAAVHVDGLDVSEYNKEYLRRYQRRLRMHLQKFGFVLSWGLAGSQRPVHETVLVDCGGGCGILSLLAKECGLGTVIYSDIYDVSCLDAETIALAIGIAVDHYVCGEVAPVADLLRRESLSCDVFVSSDVIEHVYDIDSFFASLHALSRDRLSVAMSTHANPRNPVVRRILERKQLEVETRDREYTAGHKKRDSLRSYLSIRRDIVRDCGNGRLSEEQIEALARRTRGHVARDIRERVSIYLETKTLPPPPSHRTNTCDPLTGNWADRLAEPGELRDRLAAAGFEVGLVSGCYGSPNGRLRRAVARILDMAITAWSGHGIILAPFFALHGVREGVMEHLRPGPEAAPSYPDENPQRRGLLV